MDEATLALLIMSGLIFLIFIGFLIWGISSGQFKHIEEAKYQLFKTADPNAHDLSKEQMKEAEEGEKKC
jgi:nitrogen fixation-related uncharacterized protein